MRVSWNASILFSLWLIAATQSESLGERNNAATSAPKENEKIGDILGDAKQKQYGTLIAKGDVDLKTEEPSREDISALTKDANGSPGAAWDNIGAPHGKTSWLEPVDYLIDPKPMVARDLDHIQLVPRMSREDGVEIHVWNPGWPLNSQQLRMVAVAVHQVASDHPEIPMDKNTRCFCRVIAPLPRCACAHNFVQRPQSKDKTASLDLKLRDIEENAARALALARQDIHRRQRLYADQPTEYTSRILQHRDAALDLRGSRVAGEWEKHVNEYVENIVKPKILDSSNVILGATTVGDFVCVESHHCFESKHDQDVIERGTPKRKTLQQDMDSSDNVETDETAAEDQYYSHLDDLQSTNTSPHTNYLKQPSSANGHKEEDWCVGVGKIVSLSLESDNPTCCVKYSSFQGNAVAQRYDYHMQFAESSYGAVVRTECGVPLSLLTLNCSDAHTLQMQEAHYVENARLERRLSRDRAQQASKLSVDLRKQMMLSLELLREETLARAHEYARLEKETKIKNAETRSQMLEEKRLAEIVSRKEVIGNETEGIWNLSQAFNESFHIVQEHQKYLNNALKAQKKVADGRVAQWERIVNKVRLQLEAEKSTPLKLIEDKVPSLVQQKKELEKLERELNKQQALLSAQKAGAIELLTAQEREDDRERNETNELQKRLDFSYEKTRKAVDLDRERRLEAESENKRRRKLEPLPRPQPIRPIPECGPTPGWLLSQKEQDEEILRCIAPAKTGGSTTHAAYLFLVSVFGGGDHNAGVEDAAVSRSMGMKTGVSSTIAAGCKRLGRNVSYFNVLRKIKMRQDEEQDQNSKFNANFRTSIIDEKTIPAATASHQHLSYGKESHGGVTRSTDLMTSRSSKFFQISESVSASGNSSSANMNNSISEANAILRLPLNSTRREYGPPDELGKFALIPKGVENANALRKAISCLCDEPDFHPTPDEKAPNHSGGLCLDSLDKENNMISLQWRDVVRNRIRRLRDELGRSKLELEAQKAKYEGKARTPENIDVAGMVKRIETQRATLRRATETLNGELARRWQRGPTLHGNAAYVVESQSDSDAENGIIESKVKMTPKNSASSDSMRFMNIRESDGVPGASSSSFAPVTDGSCGATLYKAWEQVKILEEETDKLRSDLRECRAKPDQYQPGCDEDLSFQVTRLRQESERRQALIAEETIHLERKLDEATNELNKVCGSTNGCEPNVEQQLRLRVKNVQECVDIRVRHDHEVSWRLIYSCLWKYRDVKIAHEVEGWFTVPQIDMSTGCKKLSPVAMAATQAIDGGNQLVELNQCLCQEWNDVTKLEENAAHEESKALAAEKLNKAQEAFREKEDEKRSMERHEAEEKVSVVIVLIFQSQKGHNTHTLFPILFCVYFCSSFKRLTKFCVTCVYYVLLAIFMSILGNGGSCL